MPIVSVQIDNYKRIETLYIEPSGAVTELTGANGQGKSSALDACAALLGGKGQFAWRPVRDGAEEARIVATLDGIGKTKLKVTRKIRTKDDGSIATTVTVESEDGARFPSPQAFLDALVDSHAFDPLSFLREDKKDQVATLQRLTGLNTEEFDKANATDFQKRTEINRRTKDLQAQAAGISIPENAPTERIDETALVDELQRAGETNAQIEKLRAEREASAKEADQFQDKAKMLRARADDLQKEIAKLLVQADEFDAAAKEIFDSIEKSDPLPVNVDITGIRGRIEQARATNAIVERHTQKAKLLQEAKASEAAADALTEQMKKRDADKQAAIAAAKMPIEGLSFGDGVVMFKGKPLHDASQAEQIRASVAIAAALNPKLKVAFIHDGSLLDKKSWALLEQFAAEHELQVFVETVDSSRPTAIVIEDGKAKAATLEAAE